MSDEMRIEVLPLVFFGGFRKLAMDASFMRFQWNESSASFG
jgi:hypothetical protein